MTEPWICTGCAVEYPGDAAPPIVCPICADERQYIPAGGQRWVTASELHAAGHHIEVTELGPGIWGLTARGVGIGQTGILIESASGNLLFDVPGFVDEAAVDAVRALGGIAAITSSHPHMFGAQSAWSAAFDGAPVWVSAADAGWLGIRPPALRLWSEPFEVLPGITLDVIGGHFPGSAVAYRPAGDGRPSVLLGGDGVMVVPDGHVAFLRGYPTMIPLSGAVVRRIADRLSRYEIDVAYNNFGRSTGPDASAIIEASARRHIDWVGGRFDHLT
ncbi:MBL fold metallo-hydrolase [Tsukamurella soli]|uniref:MBL fold metallo-hydrolase n=1 Tax=Tsukamurella soli TaxID=644556 RepID=A0ABP8K3W4_9ACTN